MLLVGTDKTIPFPRSYLLIDKDCGGFDHTKDSFNPLRGMDYRKARDFISVLDAVFPEGQNTLTKKNSNFVLLQSLLKKPRHLDQLIKYGEAREHFQLPNFFLIIFTPRESRTKRMIEQTLEIWGEPCVNILFKTVPMSNRPFKTMHLMPEVATMPFLRAGCAPFDILNPERQ